MLVSLGMHSSKTNGNGACCTCEQMVKSRKRNEVLEHLKTNLFMLAYYTINWCKFHVHRRRDL